MASPLKFDDCVSCRHKRTRICRGCDFGEFFEDIDSVQELSFDEDAAFARTNKSLVTADDEPDANPDDMIRRVENQADEDTSEDE